jgi:hypothetical protein
MLTDALKAFCERELASYQRIMEDFEVDRRKVGVSIDGKSWTDTTADESARRRDRIAELAKLVSKMA